jgi:hypothetical protein
MDLSYEFDLLVRQDQLEESIIWLEHGLRAIKRTAYHRVLGKDFLRQTNDLALWLIEFCQNAASAKRKVAAIYLEMNGFTINPKQWHCDLFGYKRAGDIYDLDWLSQWDFEGDDCFVLRGMESVQEAFAELFLEKNKPLGVRLAQQIAEYLVTARFMQLVARAHKAAKRRFPGLKGLPLLATAHDWDTVHKTE